MKKVLIFNASSYIYGAERGLINLIKALGDSFQITVVLPESGPLEERLKSLSRKVIVKKMLRNLLNRTSFHTKPISHLTKNPVTTA